MLNIPSLVTIAKKGGAGGVVAGNLIATMVLMMLLIISLFAVVERILVPLESAARECPRPLAIAGSLYFSHRDGLHAVREITRAHNFAYSRPSFVWRS